MSMPTNPYSGPEWKEFADRALNELAPMIDKSAATISFSPNCTVDVKFALELGFSIMMNKPIIAVVGHNAQVPEKLVQVADAILEMDEDGPNEELAERIGQAVKAAVEARGEL